MGFIRNTKQDMLGKLAKDAWDEGAVVFTPLLNAPTGVSGGLSQRIKDWEVMIGAILAVGWRLHTWSVVADSKGHTQAMPLFTR